MTRYPIHEYAGLVPMASPAELAVLTADIKAHGLRESIVLWKGAIVDGRNRQEACIAVGERLRVKELDDELTDEAVKAFVKSVNTRRNLTPTQKIMSACRASLDHSNTKSILTIAKEWGISTGILNNARYIATTRPEFVLPLFNGYSVDIVNSNGKDTTSVKISAIYAYVRKQEEQVKEDTTHSWSEDAYIKTQAGKEWYYSRLALDAVPNSSIGTRMAYAELANYKFSK